ncbi:hypothetical protein NM688_g310 [Phlebia brevispora]|uniref:Uncharacterized protein n=1 Tax=Phlebia brevispora TaxID=194682 RepID=A0ACC1TEE3_9APHY|nr:hypothetical protein NM688_g310 [Phlebia brevispora]
MSNIDDVGDQTPAVTEILLTISKQLQDISSKLSVSVPPEKEHDNDRKDKKPTDVEEYLKTVIEQEEPWEKIRDTLKEQDSEMIDSWKDELNNLLVFAGLFSAIVTAFTVVSFTWLQQDPEDASNTLLAHISLQLASFAGTPVSVNNPVPALALQNVTSAFSPSEIAVPVNVLWVLSLTLSLTSAFFAIAVQQWLRQLRLPIDIPARLAVELWQLRYQGLQQWQVPGFITLLPLLLQIAVVLFLAGLFIVLRSMNATVTIAFGAVAVIALGVFLVSTIIPLINPSCPYKSPLAPTALMLIFYVYDLVIYAVQPFFIAICSVILWIRHLCRLCGSIHESGQDKAFDRARIHMQFRRITHKLVESWKSVDISRFWLRREHHVVTEQNTRNDYCAKISVLNAFNTIPSNKLTYVIRCLNSINGGTEDNTLTQALIQALGTTVPGISIGEIFNFDGVLHPEIEKYIKRWPSVRLPYLGWWAFRSSGGPEDGDISVEDNMALTSFHVLNKAFTVVPDKSYLKYLLHVCETQDVSALFWFEEATPACLVFDTVRNSEYRWEENEARQLTQFAYKCLAEATSPWNWYPWETSSIPLRLCLASCTSALAAVSLHNDVAADEAQCILSSLAEFLQDTQTQHQLTKTLQKHYKAPDETFMSFSLSPMIPLLCKTLVDLAKSGAILQAPYCPSVCIAAFLSEISGSFDEEDDMVEACNHLNELVQSHSSWADLYQPFGGFSLTAVIPTESEPPDEPCAYPSWNDVLSKDPLLVTLTLIEPTMGERDITKYPEVGFKSSSYWAPEVTELPVDDGDDEKDEKGAVTVSRTPTAAGALSDTKARIKIVKTGMQNLIHALAADIRGGGGGDRTAPTDIFVPEQSEDSNEKVRKISR